MNKKISLIIIAIIITLSLSIIANVNNIDQNTLEQTFVINAVYYSNDGYVEISFEDKLHKTNHITLEVLGMPTSFHKEYLSSEFVERIQFSSPPEYGWQSIPITLVVDHAEFGIIGIKTEIRPLGEIPAKIIFSKG